MCILSEKGKGSLPCPLLTFFGASFIIRMNGTLFPLSKAIVALRSGRVFPFFIYFCGTQKRHLQMLHRKPLPHTYPYKPF